jgi:hypothetical protein
MECPVAPSKAYGELLHVRQLWQEERHRTGTTRTKQNKTKQKRETKEGMARRLPGMFDGNREVLDHDDGGGAQASKPKSNGRTEAGAQVNEASTGSVNVPRIQSPSLLFPSSNVKRRKTAWIIPQTRS